MAESPIYKFEVQVLNSEGITPDSIVRAPRVYKPQDLQAACYNTNIICKSADPVPSVAAMVRFVLLDFFVLAHRTGLYNRQKLLWESLSKASSVSVFQLKSGMLRRSPIPLFDLHIQDHRGRTLIFGHLIEPGFNGDRDISEKLLMKFLKRAEKLGALCGLFLCFPEPFPTAVLEKVSKLTGATDPVGRYESVLPQPWTVPLDLLELKLADSADESHGDANPKISLIHPDLSVAKRIRAAAVQEDL